MTRVRKRGSVIQEPPKKFRKGAEGIYDVPRNLIKSIPGIDFVEMHRTREYAWCCGSGGGVKEAFPDFAIWMDSEWLKEAKSTGAETIVTACGWCTRNFRDALEENPINIKVMDISGLIRVKPSEPFTLIFWLCIKVIDPLHGFHIADFTRIPFCGGSIRVMICNSFRTNQPYSGLNGIQSEKIEIS